MRAIAREELLPRFGRLGEGDVLAKPAPGDPDDVVTAADLAIERRLEAELRAALPGSVVVGEEAASARPGLLAALHAPAPVWVVDPLDGTRNFAAGRSPFGSMVALAVGGETRLACIYLPVEDALFVAEAGAGATLNGARLRIPPGGARARRGTVYLGHVPADVRPAIVERTRRLPVVPGPRAAAVEYTSLARGEKDFVVFFRLLPWDHAPGSLVLLEAGGEARAPDGTPYRPTDGNHPLVLARDPDTWRTVRDTLFE